METKAWKKTLIKGEQVKWDNTMTIVNDGKLDFDLHLPLTGLFLAQARASYFCGLLDALNWIGKMQTEKKVITKKRIARYFASRGYPEHAASFLNQTEGE
jgi:hypothetical protein